MHTQLYPTYFEQQPAARRPVERLGTRPLEEREGLLGGPLRRRASGRVVEDLGAARHRVRWCVQQVYGDAFRRSTCGGHHTGGADVRVLTLARGQRREDGVTDEWMDER